MSHWLERAKAWTKTTELRLALLLAVIVFVFTQNYGLFSPVAPFYKHLGAEYYNIALAMVRGHGYSDPFGGHTGPTAWMPPLFPLLLASLLLTLKRKILVAQAVVYLTVAALTAVGVIIYRIAKGTRMRLAPALAVVLYVAWLWAYYAWFFMMTHDIWMLTLLVGLLTLAFFRYQESGRLDRWTWGLLGGVAAIASPSIAFAWIALSILMLCRATREQRRRVVVSFALAGAMAVPWTARNASVFHRIVPGKSNLFYEAYQANYLDDDGIYDGTFEHHPYNSSVARAEYAKLGEMGYVDIHKQRFLQALAADPKRYVRAVVNRLLAVTVRYVPSKTAVETPFKSAIQRVFYALPILLLFPAILGRTGARGFVIGMATFSAAYLFPYVVTAFYLRYMMPLTPVLVSFLFIGLDRLAALRSHAHYELMVTK